MSADPVEAVLDYRCTCGSQRWAHGGRTGRGRCLGHDLARAVDTPPLNQVGLDALGTGRPGPVGIDTATWRECPLGCRHFRWDPEDRLVRRAVAAAADEPAVALRAYSRRHSRRRSAAKVAEGGQWSVGPSDLSACQKAIEFRERPPEGHVPKPIDKSAADVGTMLHEEMTRARRAKYRWRQFKVRVTVPGLDRPGEADEVDQLIGRVTDYKSAGAWKWDQVGKHGPPETEWQQVALYSFGLSETTDEFAPVDLEIIYINRENGSTERFLRPYSRAYALAALNGLLAVLDALDEGRHLPRVRAGDELLGPTVNSLCARWCPHVVDCWGLPSVPGDRTPEGWLYVRDDEDGAVTTTLQVYDGNRSTEGEAKRQKDYARVLLTGIEPGRYGDLTLKWTGGGLADKPDPEARMAQLEGELTSAAEAKRPPRRPEDLPYPQRRVRSNVAIQVKPVRVARVEREARA